jgi:hypothetical protein
MLIILRFIDKKEFIIIFNKISVTDNIFSTYIKNKKKIKFYKINIIK